MNRYRDSNMYIRADSLRALGTYTLIRPDMLLVGSYLKYFGWLLSDKETCVREQAVLGFLGPFREVAKAKGKREASPMDMSNAKSVIEKFLPRLADCAIDVDFQVQERAMELLLVLMREDFLDSLDDDDIWEQINLQALALDTTPAVRRDALYFIIDQLEAFDSGPAKTEAKMVERIDGIAQW
jgi:cohesin complex subunit SA-1/2